MIKLELHACPAQLTPELQAELTQEFKNTEKSVWNIDWLKDAVFNLSFGKCCYSEIRLGEESKYMEVEHFHPKVPYADKVMLWGNLLPACKKCNGTKLNHDTIIEPIINPFIDNPKDFFYLKNNFYYPRNKNEIAKRTIKKLALNDLNHFVIPRENIEKELKIRLKSRLEDIGAFEDIAIPIGRIKRLLELGNRKKEYSALVSTIILTYENYIAIEKLLIEKNLWDDDFVALKSELIFCSLLPPLE